MVKWANTVWQAVVVDDDAMTSPVEVDSFEPRSIGSSEQRYQNHDETGVVTRQDRFEVDTGGKRKENTVWRSLEILQNDWSESKSLSSDTLICALS